MKKSTDTNCLAWRDARPPPFRAGRWPTPSASRSRCGRSTPTTSGPTGSISAVFSRTAAGCRFGGAEPGFPVRGPRANERSRTEWRRLSLEKAASDDRIIKQHNSYLLRHFKVFERHSRINYRQRRFAQKYRSQSWISTVAHRSITEVTSLRV